MPPQTVYSALHKLEACAPEIWLVARASCPCLDGLEARPTVL